MKKFKRAIFLDRDGVLIKAPINKNGKPKSIKIKKEVKFTRGIKSFCKKYKKHFLLIMITNQPEYERKINTKKNIIEINNFVKKKLRLDSIFVCFSNNEKNYFRKPNPGMLLLARDKFNLNLKKSYFIGDRWRDIDAGNKVGCKTILLKYDYEEKINTKPKIQINKISELKKYIK